MTDAKLASIEPRCRTSAAAPTSRRILWLGGLFDEPTVHAAAAASPAANNWQCGLIDGIRKAGLGVDAVGHLPMPLWPRGPAWVAASAARPPHGLHSRYCSYANLPLLRTPCLRLAYRELAASASQTDGQPWFTVTYNGDPPQCAGARLVRRLHGTPWVCIVADGEAPRDADGFVFLSWDYFRSFSTARPRLHLDGGVRLIPPTGCTSDTHGASTTHRIVFAGGLGEHAGAALLARAFHRLTHPNVELLILGKGRNPGIEELARRDDRIRLLGHVPQQELDEVGFKASVFVNPRPTSHGPNRVNFPSKLLTYLAYGKPVISTRCSGLAPEYADLLVFVDREDEESLATALRQVLAWTPAERESVCKRIEAFACLHTWPSQALRLLDWMATFSS